MEPECCVVAAGCSRPLAEWEDAMSRDPSKASKQSGSASRRGGAALVFVLLAGVATGASMRGMTGTPGEEPRPVSTWRVAEAGETALRRASTPRTNAKVGDSEAAEPAVPLPVAKADASKPAGTVIKSAEPRSEATPVALADREKPPVDYELAADALSRRADGKPIRLEGLPPDPSPPAPVPSNPSEPPRPITAEAAAQPVRETVSKAPAAATAAKSVEPVATPASATEAKPAARIGIEAPTPPARPRPLVAEAAVPTAQPPGEVERVADTDEEPELTLVAAARAGRRVFIHFPAWDDDARRRAERLADHLEARGFAIAELRGVGVPVRRSSVRFFHDHDRGVVAPLRAAVSEHLREGAAVQDFRDYGRPPRPGTVEVWVANRF
jgi:hypothetical protein